MNFNLTVYLLPPTAGAALYQKNAFSGGNKITLTVFKTDTCTESAIILTLSELIPISDETVVGHDDPSCRDSHNTHGAPGSSRPTNSIVLSDIGIKK